MVTILDRPKSFGEQIGGNFGQGLGAGISEGFSHYSKLKQQEAKGRSDLVNELELQKAKEKSRRNLISEIEGNGSSNAASDFKNQFMEALPQVEEQLGFKLTPEQIESVLGKQEGMQKSEEEPFRKSKLYAAAGEHDLSSVATAEAKEKIRKNESDRSYHTSFSKAAEENVAKLREGIPRKEQALNLSRNALESGDLTFFSKDKLADATGIEVFRTAKGAQLITAAKENLLSNMGRVSARAQNIWFEQKLNSVFPKIGQSNEANLTVQEMIESELAMDKLYQSEFDRLSQEDEKEYGFVKKDIDRRARNAIKPKEKEIFNRTSYRIKEQEELEQGLSSIKQKVGKNVVKGTPLTLSMAKLYKNKYGDDALSEAKKNGYQIPTLEEWKTYRAEPQEYREGLE